MYGLKFSEISWGSTILLALMRLASASLVVAILMIVTTGQMSPAAIIAAPMFLGMCVAAALTGAFLDKMGVPIVGLLVILGFAVILGDPLVWLLKKQKPDLVPVDSFGIFNRPILFVAKS